MTADTPRTENEDLAAPPPETDGLAPGAADPSSEIDPNRPPDASPESVPAPEKETDEQWILRFVEENQHLARPQPERPPAPPPSPWDGPPSTWKVPDHLSMRHPRGGYMAMALMSRTMDDLDEVTKGERAATYEEVDKYLGHALIAEGLVPFTYTADEAIWWVQGAGGIDRYRAGCAFNRRSCLPYGARDRRRTYDRLIGRHECEWHGDRRRRRFLRHTRNSGRSPYRRAPAHRDITDDAC